MDVLLASDEPKALATAAPIARRRGLPVRPETGLREVRRPAGRLDDFAGAVRRYLRGDETPWGWEPRAEAVGRIRSALDRALAAHPAATIAAVSHGTVLALYLDDPARRAAADALWERMPFATWARVDPRTRAVLEPFQ